MAQWGIRRRDGTGRHLLFFVVSDKLADWVRGRLPSSWPEGLVTSIAWIANLLAIAFTGAVAVVAERIDEDRFGFGLSGAYLVGAMLLALWGIVTFGEPENLADGMMG
uniref:Uncharacterized protein n=1 Tax=Candidatus Kentrum sp. LPFa TaxID=2126335 RepID=A0A450XVH8_9GAMM|nr:MAG: hypothetical protein BECKLPF1236A_GA0070988_101872 [Candidatus Kentron sp. LPFa]VFK33280.1 MAG: hypothetical protein BECKLPF1236C_GA0070990_102002 [Candidatus Kentron sp. LPFa]